MKVLTPEEGDKLISRSKRDEARYEASLKAREEAALKELEEIGFRVGLYEPRSYVEPDELRGSAGGWKIGTCYALAYSVTGKTKTISAMSAVDALDQAKAWAHYQETRLSPELRFVIAKGDEHIAVPVMHRPAGDTAQTAARRAATERRLIGFTNDGTAQVVDSHGTPMHEATHASQFSDADTERTGPR